MAIENWADSLVQTLADSGIQTVPPEYVREVEKAHLDPNRFQVPIIDMQLGSSLLQHDHFCKDQYDTIAAQISKAAENWGFFQIINHGIPDSLIARVQAASKAFFQLPIEEKEPYAKKAGNAFGYGSKDGYSPDAEAKLDWADYYYNAIWPANDRDMSKWPIQLSDFTESMDEYSRELFKLSEVLMEVLSRDLGLESENSLNESVGGDRKAFYIRMNYYPPCPEPDLVVGMPPHSDPNVLTILLDDQTPGLQIRKDGVWIDVDCVPGALVVNIANQMKILSNGKYKSIEHRAMVHKDRSRMSWAVFCVPPLDVVISPRRELIDGEHPQLYQGVPYRQYLNKFFKKRICWKGSRSQGETTTFIEPTFMDVLFGSDAFVQGPDVVPSSHVDEDRCKGIAQDYTQSHPSPTQDMPVEETQAAADEGVEAAVMFTHEWVETHQSCPDEAPSRQMGDSLSELTLDSSKRSWF